jgi:hypothetical protein
MKKLLLLSFLILSTTLPFTGNAQVNSFGKFYAVAEVGATRNTLHADNFNLLDTQNNTGAAFGGALGYRIFFWLNPHSRN